MGHNWVRALGLMAVFGAASPALAVTLKNEDTRSYDIDVIEKGNRKSLKIGPGATLDALCEKDCLISLVGVPDAVYIMEGKEKVRIEKGLVYYVEPYISKGKPEEIAKDAVPEAKGAKPPNAKPEPKSAPAPADKPSGSETPKAN